MVDGRRAAHQQGVVAAAATEQDRFQVMLQCERGFVRLPRFPDHRCAGVGLGIWIKPMHHRSASTRVLANLEVANEILVQSSEAAAVGIERGKALRPRRGEREMQAAAVSLPVGLALVLPFSEPFQAVTDVADLVEVDLFQYRRRRGVADLAEERGVVF